MDGGPYRVPRQVDRRAVSRSEPAARPAVEPQPVAAVAAPKPVHRAAPHRVDKPTKSWKRFLLPAGGFLVALLLIVGGWLLWSSMQKPATAIDASKYQAVFFTNGQVYFGKLQTFNDESLKLTDIYYLQSTQAVAATDSKNPQETSTDQNDVQLIKLGDEIHGPQDEMVISKAQVLFYENLKSDGKVAKSIENFKKP